MNKKSKIEFKKGNPTKIIAIIVSIFAIAYFVYQIYMFTYVPYETEVALVSKYTDQIEIKGIVLKQEQILKDAKQGIVKYMEADSSKIVAGTNLATMYSNAEDLKKDKLIKEKQEKLELLKSLEEKKEDIRANTQNITTNIKKQQIDFVNALQENKFKKLHNIETSFLEQMLKQEIVINSEISYNKQIDMLNNEIQQLTNSISKQGIVINAPISGYFTPKVDGLEGITYDVATKDLSVNAVNKLLKQDYKVDNSKIGKVITSTNWNFLGVFDAKYIEKLKEGDSVELIFPQNPSFVINAEIEKINYKENDKQGSILLKSSNMGDHVVDLRLENPSIILKESSGIKVPKSALRIMEIEEETKDGKTVKVSTPGVYISMGQIVKFKKVDIEFESDDYVISSTNQDNSYIQIYDEIILEGDDLYDGKPIR